MPRLVYANLPDPRAVMPAVADAVAALLVAGQQTTETAVGTFADALHRRLHHTFGGWTSNCPLRGRLDHVYRLFPSAHEDGQIRLEAEVYRYDRNARRLQAVHERQPLDGLLARLDRLDELTA